MIVNYSSDITVANIAERDAISIKTNGMRVFVQDASADSNADDSAIYSWNGTSWDLENADVETDQKYLDKVLVEVGRTTGWDIVHGHVFVDGTKSTNPKWVEIGNTGFYAYRVDVNKEAWASLVLPHSYKVGGNIYLQINFTTDGTNTNEVRWQMDYSIIKTHNQVSGGNLFPASTGTVGYSPLGTAYMNNVAELQITDVSKAEPGSMIQIKLTRITNGLTDNTDDVFGLSFNCQFEIDRVGTLNRTPPYNGV